GPGRGGPTRTRSPPPTCATAGPPTGWPGCASPRSSCSPPRARSTTTGRTCGTSPSPTGSPPAAPRRSRPRPAGAPSLLGPPPRFGADTRAPAAATTWWEQLTAAGGEGMVVKPAANLTRGPEGLVQPGLKVRGREYLRLIYGPDYTEPANLTRLRQRALSHKRSLALREYALGLEALDRVAAREPLWRVHESVLAVLALESEPVDPRL